jgi:Mannose-1-phosphate guanylyltransferase
MTIERVKGISEVIILTNPMVANKLDGKYRMIVEPISKNTAPALIYATYLVHNEYGSTLISALPADHHIYDVENFRKALLNAYDYAKKTGNIVTFGIKPTHPHTGYGYIERGEKVGDGVYEVLKFHEKPDLKKAEEYVKSGRFYWNSGMFVWESGSFLEIVKETSPEIYNLLGLPVEEFFKRVPNISVDYAVMEKTKKILVMEASFGWSDVGSYRSLYEILPKDENNNAFSGEKPLSVNSGGNLVISDRKVVIVGLEGVGIVEGEGIIMVLKLERDQEVKEALRRYKDENRDDMRA